MKRFLTLVLAAGLLMTFTVGCGDDTSAKKTNTGTTPAPKAGTGTAPAPKAP